MSAMSRYLKGTLQLGTLSVSPSKSMGGIGFHEQHYAHLAVFGKRIWSCMS